MLLIYAIHLEVTQTDLTPNRSGLGLTGGILDAGCLADAFEGIYNEAQSDALLSTYSDIRRGIFLKYINPWSQENVKRLYSLDPETAKDDPFLKNIANGQADPELRKAFLDIPRVLRKDIREHFVTSK
jgi:hypothetical protein